MIIVYTDGSNVFNGKPWSYGGYGYTIEYSGLKYENGQMLLPNLNEPVTNNRAELLAILDALEILISIGIKKETIKLYSDSQWCIKCAMGEWKRKKNKDLWDRFIQIKHKLRLKGNRLVFEWVKGHNGNEGNERVDYLASMYRDQAKPSSEQLNELKCIYHQNMPTIA